MDRDAMNQSEVFQIIDKTFQLDESFIRVQPLLI